MVENNEQAAVGSAQILRVLIQRQNSRVRRANSGQPEAEESDDDSTLYRALGGQYGNAILDGLHTSSRGLLWCELFHYVDLHPFAVSCLHID